MQKTIAIIAIALFLVMSGLQAQHKNGAHKHHKGNPEQRTELCTYYEQQMYPILKAEHDKFDAALSPDDYQFLQNKRAEAKQLQALHQQVKELIKEGQSKEEAKAAFSTQTKALKDKRKLLVESLQPFIENNKTLINQTKNNLKPYQEKWKIDRRAIHEKYNSEGVAKQDEKRKKRTAHFEKLSEEQKLEKAARRENRKVLKFLLWDGEMKKTSKNGKKSQNVDSDSKNIKAKKTVESYQLSAFPNPATSQANISFELLVDAKIVNLKLMDFKGAVLREIPMKNLTPGKHTVQLNLSGINQGKYVLSLEVDGKTNSKTLLVK